MPWAEWRRSGGTAESSKGQRTRKRAISRSKAAHLLCDWSIASRARRGRVTNHDWDSVSAGQWLLAPCSNGGGFVCRLSAGQVENGGVWWKGEEFQRRSGQPFSLGASLR
jgi:hypothetical protein